MKNEVILHLFFSIAVVVVAQLVFNIYWVSKINRDVRLFRDGINKELVLVKDKQRENEGKMENINEQFTKWN